MTVKELIEKLKEYDENAKVITITVGTEGNWSHTDHPTISGHSNMFGKRVFIH